MSHQFKIQNSKLIIAMRICGLAALCLVIASRAATTNSVQSSNAPAAATSTNAYGRTDYSSFKIIADRNIFSANRSGRVVSHGPARKPTKVDTFTLVGTVDYSKGLFAIFDGSSSAFTKTVKVGDSLAGFKVTDVDLDHATIASTNGANTVLHVGSQMRRVDDGEWTLGSGPAPTVAKAESKDNGDEPAAASTSSNSESSDEPAPSAADNDVLKKLMQKRKAEVKNESE
jgi:hypothetical protein